MSEYSRVIGDGQFLSLVEVNTWEFVVRTRGSSAVAIAAKTEDGDVLLVEQFRPAVRQTVIELPAGLVGDDALDEPVLEAARRELEEETGYTANHLRIVSAGPPSAGLSSEIVSMVVATQLSKIHSGGGVGEENIITHLVPERTIHQWLSERAKEGALIDPKVYAGLYWLFAPHA